MNKFLASGIGGGFLILLVCWILFPNYIQPVKESIVMSEQKVIQEELLKYDLKGVIKPLDGLNGNFHGEVIVEVLDENQVDFAVVRQDIAQKLNYNKKMPYNDSKSYSYEKFVETKYGAINMSLYSANYDEKMIFAIYTSSTALEERLLITGLVTFILSTLLLLKRLISS